MAPKKKIIISSIIFGIVILALICFLIYPLVQGIKRNSQDLVRAKEELTLFQTKLQEVEQTRESYNKLKSDLDKIDNFFIDSEVPIDFIKFLEKTASDAGLSIDISPLSLKIGEAAPWNSIGFSLILIGSFPDFSKFLEKIETASYLLEVQGLGLKRYETSPSNIKADLTIKVYTN